MAPSAHVTDIIPEFASVFPFDSFNAMQRTVMPTLLETDDNVVVGAPTASGKTALAELAMCRCLAAGGTALFIAPLRALTSEREADWEPFEALGYSVYVVTGERDLVPERAARADILVMTPEKVDSATRKHDSHRYRFITDIDCCVIDEVHLLDTERRGSVLEVTIARLRRLTDPRIVALSATMPNVDDIAAWVDAPDSATFRFDQDARPVELNASVETYTHGENAFADKYRRLYRGLELAQPHLEEDGQALVFVASRRDAREAAEKARDRLPGGLDLGPGSDYEAHQEIQSLANDTLRDLLGDGVAFHHAGLSQEDRACVERWFRAGHIGLLVSTTTLAWGVNLPARCVIIRDTTYHDPLAGPVDIRAIDVLQMLGRAGRPGYDDTGHGYIISAEETADRYRRLLDEGTTIESQLGDDLSEHLNAEIAMGTVGSISEAVTWLETTYFAVRNGDTRKERRERIEDTVVDLAERGFLERDENGTITATDQGILATRYYLRLETARDFWQLIAAGAPTEAAILRTIGRAEEFARVRARRAERQAIETLTADEDGESWGIRKVLAVLRAQMRNDLPAALRGDAWIITKTAIRLLSALQVCCRRQDDPWSEHRVRRLEARIEHGVEPAAIGLTAIDGIGGNRARRLANAGITTPAELTSATQASLDEIGLSPGVADTVRQAAASLPRPRIEWGELPETIDRGTNRFVEVPIETVGEDHRAGVRVLANDIEMYRDVTHLGQATVPIAIHSGENDTVTFSIEIVFPDLAIPPYRECRDVQVV